MTKSKVSPTTLVVYKQNQQNKNNNNKNKNNATRKAPVKLYRNPGMLARVRSEGAYQYALCDPFSEYALGARVPDMYSAHTITSVVKKSISISTNAAGNSDFIVLPNLAACAMSALGSLVGGSTTTYGDNTTLATGIILGPTISQVMDTYRIVGMGIRLTGMAAATATQGKVVIASIPQSTYLYLKNFTLGGITPPTNASRTEGVQFASLGCPYTAGGIDPTQLIQFPGAEVRSLNDLSIHPLEIIPKLADPGAFCFRHPADDLSGFATVDVALAGATVTGNPSFVTVDGFEAPVICITGGPASNTGALDLEIIYHLEGTPNVSASTLSANLTPAAQRSPVNWAVMQKALSTAANSPTIRRIVGDGLISAATSYMGAGAVNAGLRVARSIYDEL